MKYLIISKGPSLALGLKKDHLAQTKDIMEKAMKSGKVEAVYGLVAGGTVWVINTDSHASLARGLRKYNLADSHDVEVYPIVDGMAALDAHHKHAN